MLIEALSGFHRESRRASTLQEFPGWWGYCSPICNGGGVLSLCLREMYSYTKCLESGSIPCLPLLDTPRELRLPKVNMRCSRALCLAFECAVPKPGTPPSVLHPAPCTSSFSSPFLRFERLGTFG